jgi:prepilin-type N-terminal cleavage/methylation domain-containing protein/prepilin-type processing-associated H-X9-DG protein
VKRQKTLKQIRCYGITSHMAPRRAFTLLELLVTISIVAILAALLLPVLSKGKGRAQGVYCLNNGKQMMAALFLYTGDNHDFFPPNPDDGNIVAGYNWCSGQAGIGEAQEFNSDVLKDPKRSLLITYLAENISVFHCPGDRRMGKYQGTNASLIGQVVPAARTFSMNQAVGTIDSGYDKTGPGGQPGIIHSGAPVLPVNGPWLNNEDNHRRNSPWSTYGKESQIGAPGPSMLWVLVDEDARGLNDAAFAFEMEDANSGGPAWIDTPGTYHNGGCGFAFADGHSESHHWFSTTPKSFGAGSRQIDPNDSQDQKDWAWIQQRTSARAQ